MSQLLKEGNATFNMNEIEVGYLIWAKHNTWEVGMTGIVVSVNANQITVQFPNRIGSSTNHFIINAADVGLWKIRYSENLEKIMEYSEGGEKL